MVTVRRKDLGKFVLFVILVFLLAWYVLGRGLGGGRAPEPMARNGGVGTAPAGPLAGKEKTAPANEQSASGRDYYIDSRLERERTRAQQVELLKELTNNPGVDAATKKEAYARLLKITEDMGKELEMENLIRARGFEDALVYLGASAATVLVKAGDLNKTEVAKIADIVARVSGIRLENITILPKPR